MATDSNLRLIIGKRVHDFRILNEYTQAQFAECIDISINFLSEIENGKKGMSYETLYKLCNHFHISADYILFGSVSDSPENAKSRLIDIAGTLSAAEIDAVIDYLKALKKLRDVSL